MTEDGLVASPAYARQGGWGVEGIVAELRAARERWRAAQHRSLEFAVREFPSRDALKEIAAALCGALFPMRLGPPACTRKARTSTWATPWTPPSTPSTTRCAWN